MNFLMVLVLAVTGSLTITPTVGPAPFTPNISIAIEGAFTGTACAYIDDLSTQGHDEIELCSPTIIVPERATVPLELTGSTPGNYTFTGHLHSVTGEVTVLNTVSVTVQ